MKKNICKILYWIELMIGLIVSSTVTIALNVWLFRTLSGLNKGYDSIPERIIGAVIIITLIIAWVVGNNPFDAIYNAKKRYRMRSNNH